MTEASLPPVVALVCSAGGLDALTRVLQPLPPTFPAPLIALQHSDPGGPAARRRCWPTRCAVGVTEAAEGEPLAAGHTVIASDEASSQVYDMPAASIARAGTVDHVRGLDTIGELLAELVATGR